ncbi:MAG: leucyl/phenylalanyl-tRNA--protein transferase [Candidatus Thiosymbion ectosymbiont of Robbea hypermnestra]|nr:leucyl/phenylalanyl-tRNA--protein transferase [Candidatus Thiosymbion ectosymbiont of Robbea hypermnestra]
MLYLLDPRNSQAPFPSVEMAEREPDGLLAMGGDLSATRLINAYRRGIFPWFGAGDPILWWSPDPRTVLLPDRLRISRTLRKTLRGGRFEATMDRDFDAVITACAQPRAASDDTWLVPEMIAAYGRLHRRGVAHSVEVWRDGALAGGLYGVAIGRVFFGESMFTRVSDASKVALVHLCGKLSQWGFRLIDCQVLTAHLIRLGAEPIPRADFIRLLDRWCSPPDRRGSWDDGRTASPLVPGDGSLTGAVES